MRKIEKRERQRNERDPGARETKERDNRGVRETEEREKQRIERNRGATETEELENK